jgi:putative transposase
VGDVPLIFGLIDEQHAAGRGVESICQVLRVQGLQVAPRSYRAWRTRPASARALTDAELIDRLLVLRTAGPAGRPAPEILYGRRKMTAWLNRAMTPEGRPPVSSTPCTA